MQLLENAVLEAVQRLRNGTDSDGGFGVLDARLRPRLLRYFESDPGSRSEAEDLVQKTLLRVYQGVGKLEREDRFLPWLFVIARNVRLTAQVRRQREGHTVELEAATRQNKSDARHLQVSNGPVEDREHLERALEVVETLPPQQRQCLILRLREELPYEEIARILRLSVHTVRNHLAAARRNLRAWSAQRA